jgi:hypothetical protein
MSHLLIYLLKAIQKAFANFIAKLEAKFKNMETEVKSEVAGLKKTVTLKAFSIDEKGNFSAKLAATYTDADGNEMVFKDPAKAEVSISGEVPDETVDPSAYTPEQQTAKANSDAILAALAPAIKSSLPDAV